MTLRVKIEIVPFGDETKVKELHRFDISRIGQCDFGHREYEIIEINSEKGRGFIHERTVLHRPDLGAIALVRKVLNALHKWECSNE